MATIDLPPAFTAEDDLELKGHDYGVLVRKEKLGEDLHSLQVCAPLLIFHPRSHTCAGTVHVRP